MRIPLLILSGFVLLSNAVPLQAATIKLVGSDLLADVLTPALERYEAESGDAVEVDFIGTLPALTSLTEDRATVGLLAIPASDPLPEDRFTLIPFSYQVAYVVINAGNPTLELSLPQLSGMFSTEPQARIERWIQADQKDASIASRSVQIVLQEDPDSVVVEMFKFIALQSRSIKSNANYVTTTRELCDIVAADLGAIGVANQPPVGKGVKALAVSSGESGSFAFGPTPENIYYGDYLLRLPFYIAVPKEQTELPKGLIKALLSEETATELAAAGFLPLPENVRKRTIQGLDR